MEEFLGIKEVGSLFDNEDSNGKIKAVIGI